MTPGYNTPTEARATFLKLYTKTTSDVDLQTEKCTARGLDIESQARTIDFPPATTGFKRFPFDNFTYYLTLFSKFFSSFPHGTCSLSVSRQYLALDGIYHPFWAAIPNNPTLRKRITWRQGPDRRRGCHPLWRLVPKDFCPACPRKRFYKLQFALVAQWDFKFELFPLHSPLLRESLLVSFPPLIDMLKFSGSSCLIWDLEFLKEP